MSDDIIHTNDKVIDANRRFYSKTASTYVITARSQKNFQIYFGNLLRRVIKNARGGGPLKVLDIGTGTGFALRLISDVLNNKQLQLFGCDISQEMLDIAKRSFPAANFELFDGLQLPRYKTKFDVIVFCSVLHHIFDPMPLLNQAVNLLAERGIIIITQEPNPSVNRLLQKFLRLIRLQPDTETQYVEYHQYITSGVSPKKICDFFEERNLSIELSYTNANLLDEVSRKFGYLGLFFKPLILMAGKYVCLNYTVIAKKV